MAEYEDRPFPVIATPMKIGGGNLDGKNRHSVLDTESRGVGAFSS